MCSLAPPLPLVHLLISLPEHRLYSPCMLWVFMEFCLFFTFKNWINIWVIVVYWKQKLGAVNIRNVFFWPKGCWSRTLIDSILVRVFVCIYFRFRNANPCLLCQWICFKLDRESGKAHLVVVVVVGTTSGNGLVCIWHDVQTFIPGCKSQPKLQEVVFKTKRGIMGYLASHSTTSQCYPHNRLMLSTVRTSC